MNYIVYLAYGKEDNLNECIYSLYSLIGNISGTEVIIYTDNVDYISGLAPDQLTISYHKLSTDKIARWKGEKGFLHRLKIRVLIDFMESLGDAKANILYLDGDTKIRKSLVPVFQKISEGWVYMHLDEGEIRSQTKTFKLLNRYMKSGHGMSREIPPDQHMWNAGVLGFSTDYKTQVYETLELTDALYEEVQNHTIEQLAFSMVLSRTADVKLIPAEDEVFHYWNFKEFRAVLSDFFIKNKTETEILHELPKIDVEVMIRPKREYENLPMIPKFIRKLGTRWTMPEYHKGS